MKAVDPSIKIVAVGSPGLAGTGMLEPIANGYEREIQSLPSSERQKAFDRLSITHPKPKALQELWWPTVIKIAADHFDAVAIHPYYMWGNANYTDFLNGSVKSDKRVAFVAQLRRYLDEHVPDKHIELALTEWNVGPQEGWENGSGSLDGMAAALMIAELVPAYLESGADIAHFWPLRRATWRTDFRSLLDTNTNETRPPWQVLKLLAHNLGDRLVKVECSQKQVYAYAGLDDDTRRLAVFIVNENLQPESILTQISVNGHDINDYRGTTLTAPELMSRQIQYQTPNATLGDGLIKVELPPHSLTMITIEGNALIKAVASTE
jgi:hypothetical protein